MQKELIITPFIVAEMSGNHNQSLERALKIIDAAAENGVHAVKLQTYTADTMTLPNVCTIDDSTSLWYGRDLYDLYQEAPIRLGNGTRSCSTGPKRGVSSVFLRLLTKQR